MTQMDLGLNLSTKRTRKREFLDEMTRVVPWQKLIALIEPHYPKGKIGRPPFPIETMLRIHFMQQWFSLSDPAMEEALHDIPLYREFALLDAGITRLPDESTILRFRHLLEAHQLSAKMLATVNEILQAKGLMLKAGSAVDATLIAAPSSTEKPGTRDPEMRQTKKGGSWYFGMKAHIGVDAQSGLVHNVKCTPANVHDITVAHALLHGEEQIAFADAGYQGIEKRGETGAVEWHVAMRPSKRRKLDKTKRLDKIYDKIERLKASVRAKVEHPFRVLKRQFGYMKARYRGLAKNTAQIVPCPASRVDSYSARRRACYPCSVTLACLRSADSATVPPEGPRRSLLKERSLRRPPFAQSALIQPELSLESQMSGKLLNKVALVTGGSRGIGRAVALAFAREGASLIGVHYASNAEAAEATVRDIEALGAKAVAIRADLKGGKEAAELVWDQFRTAVVAVTGDSRFDILVNNAGVAPAISLAQTTETALDEILATNLKAPFFLIQVLADHIRDHGRIINVSTGFTRVAAPTHPAYAASKGALETLTLALAPEFGSRGITVNAAMPGVTETDMNASWINVPEARAGAEAMSVFGRVGQPPDVADIIAFIASNEARWMTGQVVDATGGARL